MITLYLWQIWFVGRVKFEDFLFPEFFDISSHLGDVRSQTTNPQKQKCISKPLQKHHSVLIHAKFLYDHESYRQENEMPNIQVENGISCPGKNIKI